jgi:hypothetical protein
VNNSWNPLAYKPSEVAKAILAFIAPALVSLGSAILAESDGGSKITGQEWLAAVTSAVLTSIGVFAVGNKKVNPPPNPEGGYTGAGGLIAVLAVVLIVVGLLGLFGILALSLPVAIVFVVVGLVLLVVSRTAL